MNLPASLRLWRGRLAKARLMVTRRERQLAAHRVMHTSKTGVAFIKSFEGYRGHPYRDAVGVWTIGYGHTRHVTQHTAFLTEPAATKLLADDLAVIYEPPVRQLGIPLTQGQFDALVSLVYNLGPGILDASHTIGAALRARKYHQAADAFLLYDHAGGKQLLGLTRRRQAERHTFLGGTP